MNKEHIWRKFLTHTSGQGKIIGHDLMAPHSVLRDEAKVIKLGPSSPPYSSRPKGAIGNTRNSATDFLSYVDEILEGRSSGENGLPSSTRRSSNVDTPATCKDAIDVAILRSNLVTATARSPNRFEIARNGRRIAVVVLNRPAHRLGETVFATVDFTGAALPCYAVRATLESSEKVAPALAIRSDASIRRATRKIHSSFFENTLYATRVVVSPAVPISATPTILTTGINLEWELRFEFVTASNTPAPRGTDTAVSSTTTSLDSGGLETAPRFASGASLLEPLSQDDRGVSLASLENLSCESFEIAIPLTVYGETVRESLPEENDGYSI